MVYVPWNIESFLFSFLCVILYIIQLILINSNNRNKELNYRNYFNMHRHRQKLLWFARKKYSQYQRYCRKMVNCIRSPVKINISKNWIFINVKCILISFHYNVLRLKHLLFDISFLLLHMASKFVYYIYWIILSVFIHWFLGYGHSTPNTISGKLFTMFYAIVGIPLGLVMFQSIGERLNKFSSVVIRNVKKLLNCKDVQVKL